MSNRVEVLREALHQGERGNLLAVARSLSTEELQQLFGEWVNLARCAHSPFEPAWKIILSLPREWVLERIEQEVEPILAKEEYDDYWMFLQLFDQLDRDLTFKLARRAIAHSDPDIHELGEDYLQKLAAPANHTPKAS